MGTSEVLLVFIQFKNTFDPTRKGGLPWGISASNSTRDRYLNPARCWLPMTTLQTVPIPLVAQHFSKMDKNFFGPASWVKKKYRLMQKCWLLGTKYLWHHVSDKYQHTKLIWFHFLFHLYFSFSCLVIHNLTNEVNLSYFCQDMQLNWCTASAQNVRLCWIYSEMLFF